MALSLPQYFAEDIQKRDTSLVPIVVFGNYDPNGTDWLSSVYRISTNNITYAGQYYRPLLLNIPSIKESIDYKSKKHKISSITLSVSNLIHNNERFEVRKRPFNTQRHPSTGMGGNVNIHQQMMPF